MTTKEKLLEGFDYKPMRDWCRKNYLRVNNLVNDPAIPGSVSNCVSEIVIHGDHPSDWFDRQWLQTMVFDRFPMASIERLRPFVKNIFIEQTTWFDWNSTASVPRSTTCCSDALSPTALIPASCYLSRHDDADWHFDIYVYPLPDNFAPPGIQQLLVTQAIAHELGHGLAKLAWRLITKNLELGDKIVDGEEAISQFVRLIRGVGPISEYSASCRGEDDSHETAISQTMVLSRWAEEELVECIAAALLGWTKTEKLSTNSSFKPFKDRPKVYDWVVKFLNATWEKD